VKLFPSMLWEVMGGVDSLSTYTRDLRGCRGNYESDVDLLMRDMTRNSSQRGDYPQDHFSSPILRLSASIAPQMAATSLPIASKTCVAGSPVIISRYSIDT
jgi:hypothetical protein